jgi:hypothetical protein
MAKSGPLTDEDRANLVAYLDGELDPSTSAELEAKLTLNPQARAEADALRRTWGLLDYLQRPQPSPHFTNSTMERLATVSGVAVWGAAPWRTWVLGAGWAAALVAAGAIGFASGKLFHRDSGQRKEFSLDVDEALVRDLGIIENRRLYDNVESIDFLRALANPDDPDLFADENSDS